MPDRSREQTESHTLMYNYIHKALKFENVQEDNDECYDIAMSLGTSPTNLLYLSDAEIALRLYRWYVDDKYKELLMAYIRMKNPKRPSTGYTCDVPAQYWVDTGACTVQGRHRIQWRPTIF